MIQHIDQIIESQISGAQQINFINNRQLLYPERMRSQYFQQQEQLNRLRVIYLQDFIHGDFKYQLEAILRLFCSSSYAGFSFYPVLDIDIDWESTLGVSTDGICLCDNETQLGYIYLSYNMFNFKIVKDMLVIQLVPLQNDQKSKEYLSESRSKDSINNLLDSSKISLFQKSILKITNKLDLPVYTKINLEQKHKNKYDGALTNFQVFHTENILDKNKTISFSPQEDTQQYEIKQLNVRKQLKIKMLNQQQIKNLELIIQFMVKTHYLNERINRNLRVQSKCQTQLFHSLYMNYCLMYCGIPNTHLLNQLKEINEQILLKNQQIIFNDITVKDQQMTINDLRALCDSLTKALNYNKDSQIVEIYNVYTFSDKKDNVIDFIIGKGTPYSPFVPAQKTFYKNLMIQKLQFINNGFNSDDFILPISQLIKNPHLQGTLAHFTYTGNLLKQNSAIFLGYNLSFCKKLQSLNIIDTKCNGIGLSCILYLFYQNGISLNKLATNTQLKTANQVLQLAKYIIYSSKQNQQDFQELYCTNMFINTNQCYQFLTILQKSNCRITNIIMEDQEFQKVLILKEITDNIEI